jgi:putative transposase
VERLQSAVIRDLKDICRAPTEDGGLAALDAFAQSWNVRYPQISKSWRANQVNLSTLSAYPEDIRRAI